MFLLLSACVSPSHAPTSQGVEQVPGLGGGPAPEEIPAGDAPEESTSDPLVTFDHPHGLYDAPFQLAITTEVTGGELRYTLDGRDPVRDGVPYTGPIAVDTTTILRAAVADGDVALTRTVTATYLFPADVPGQEAPRDWPDEWWTDETGGPWAADYEMDPEVTDGATWAAHAPTLFADLPVLSLVMDPDDLWDERTGIHENPLEHGEAWERPVTAELIDGDQGFTIDCGIRSHGGSSRYPDKTPKKSFRLHFNDDYGGPKTLEYPLFRDSSRTSFEKLVLRAGYNRSWVHFDATGRKRADYARERFGHEAHRAMGHPAPHLRYAHLFLDGVYWGLYQLEERPDEDFLSYYVGGTSDDWDVLNMGEVVAGDDAAWRELMALMHEDLSDPDTYAAVAERLDLDAFADYLVLEYTLGNVDWPDRNWYAAHRRVDGGKWFFLTWDNEFIMSTTSTVVMNAVADDPGTMFDALRVNPEFQVVFADAVERNLGPGGALTPERTVPLFTSIADAIVPGVLGESARWGDHWRDVRGALDAELYTYDDQWRDEYDRITTDFLPNRGPYALLAFQGAGVWPTTAVPDVTPGTGTIEAGDTVALDGAGATVYYTLDGSDPRAAGGGVATGALRYTGPVRIDADATLHARALSDTAWSALAVAVYTVE